MKKTFAIILTIAMLLSMVACSNTTTTSESSSNQTEITTTISEEPTTEPSESTTSPTTAPVEELATFKKNATIPETVLFEENGVKISATALNYGNYSVDLDLLIENNSEKELSFISGSVGYSCNSVNGYMINDGYLNCDVAAGKKAYDTISFDYDALMLYGIYEIADIEIGFDISDDSYEHIYTGPCQLKSSAYDTYNYAENTYQISITNPAVMEAFEYTVNHFTCEASYDVAGIQLLSACVTENQDSEIMLLLELENTTDTMISICTSDIALNGMKVCDSTWSSDTISPHKYGIIDVKLTSVLDEEFWSVYGIGEVANIDIALHQNDSEGNKITEPQLIKISIPNTIETFDAEGTEVYNNNGIRIVAKEIVDDSSEYSDDIYVLLFAENHSGNTIKIEDVYNSLSVNGFMTNFSCPTMEIEDGERGILEIQLWGYSLEDNQIQSASDITEVEVSFEIKEGRNVIDTATIKIAPQ